MHCVDQEFDLTEHMQHLILFQSDPSDIRAINENVLFHHVEKLARGAEDTFVPLHAGQNDNEFIHMTHTVWLSEKVQYVASNYTSAA